MKMSNEEPKSPDMKEVLAPIEGLRDDLIATAVKFLQNPKVAPSPLDQKKAFLERKGLTKEEVDAAMSRAGDYPDRYAHPASSWRLLGSTGSQPGPTVPPRLQVGPYSQWTRARDVLAVVTMITGISYAAYRLYKEFLRPWLFGLPTSESRLDKMERSLSETLTKVISSLASLDEKLTSQQDRLQVLSHDVYSRTGTDTVSSLQSNQNITEIKQELTSIKGLLLNRRQFPPVPTTTPLLPSWQLASSEDTTTAGSSRSAVVTMSTSPAPGSPVKLDMETSEDTQGNSDSELPISHIMQDSISTETEILSETSDKTTDMLNMDTIESETSVIQKEAEVQSEAAGLHNEADRNQNEAEIEESEVKVTSLQDSSITTESTA